MPQSKLCPSCNQLNRPAANHCANCGHALRLAERFTLGELVVQNGPVSVYVGADTWRCGNCGRLRTGLKAVCPHCGKASVGHECYLRKQPSPPRPNATSKLIETWIYFEDQNVWFGASPAPSSRDKSLHARVAFASDQGGRLGNEDALLVHTTHHVFEGRVLSCSWFAVADGMGGQEQGELASQLAIKTIHHELQAFLGQYIQASSQGHNVKYPRDLLEALSQSSPGDPMLQYRTAIQAATLAANRQVGLLRHQERKNLGTTLCLALLVGTQAALANVGDSRIYLFRAGQLQQLTRDHSLVSDLVQQGLIQPQDIYTHPQRNLLTRAVDGSLDLIVDTFDIQLEPNDWLVLCTDGLWATLGGELIAQTLKAISDPQQACETLITQANQAGSEDNISIIVVAWPGAKI